MLILLPTDSNKLLMQWRGPYTVESRVGANDYRVKMGSKTKTYHVNMLKKYISREPEGNVVPVGDTDGATVAVAGVIHQDVDPELGEVCQDQGYSTDLLDPTQVESKNTFSQIQWPVPSINAESVDIFLGEE